MEGSLTATYTDFLVFVFLLFASGFFASSEVVFFSVSRPILMKYSKSRLYPFLIKLLSKPKEVLVSILIGNEVVNVLISSYGAKLFTDMLGREGAFISAGDFLHHVHIASRERRKMPGEDGAADNYIDGFRGLKEIGYQDYISFECGSVGDKKETLPAAVKLIREQWKKA